MKFALKFFNLAFALVSVFTLLLFVVGPARSLGQLAGLPPEKLAALFTPLLFVLGLCSWALFLWKEIVAQMPVTRTSEMSLPRPHHSRKTTMLLVSLLVVLFAQTLWQSDVPLDWDEHEHVTLLASSQWKRAVNPFLGSENHALASLSAYLSMKLFGVNKFAARLPALGYALFFLGMLLIFARRFLPSGVAAFLFALLAFNPMIIYTLHQMRGYTPLLGFTLLCLFTALTLIFDESKLSRREQNGYYAVFFISSFLAIASHTFGGLFLGFLFLSFLHFGFFYRTALSRQSLTTIHRLSVLSAILLAAYAILSVFILLHLQETGFAGRTGELPQWLKTLMLYRPFTIFGIVRLWEIKLCLLTVVGLGIVAFLRPDRKEPRPFFFIFCFLTIAIAFFGLASLVLKFTVLEGRMLQPFLILFLWFVLQAAYSIEKRALRFFTLAAVVALFLLPGLLHHDQSDEVALFFADTEHFAHSVEVEVKPYEHRCFTFSGDPSSVGYYEHFYFHDEPKETNCDHRFHVHIEHGLFDRISPPPATLSRFEALYSDKKGRTLFKENTTNNNLTASDL